MCFCAVLGTVHNRPGCLHQLSKWSDYFGLLTIGGTHKKYINLLLLCRFFSTDVPKITVDLNDKCMSFCGDFFFFFFP